LSSLSSRSRRNMRSARSSLRLSVEVLGPSMVASTITSISSSKGMLVTAVKSALAPLMEFEPKMKADITKAINDKLQPIVSKLAQENAKKVFDVIVTPIGAIYLGAVKGFAASFPAERDITWRYGDSLFAKGGVWAEFDKMAGSDALALLTDILSGRTSYGLAYDAVYDAAHLLRKAEVDFDDVSKGDKAAVLAKLKFDAKLHLNAFMISLLGGIIGDPVAEQIKPVLDAALEPICAMIPEPLKEICDPQQVASQVVDDVVQTALVTLLGKSLDGVGAQIDAVACAAD